MNGRSVDEPYLYPGDAPPRCPSTSSCPRHPVVMGDHRSPPATPGTISASPAAAWSRWPGHRTGRLDRLAAGRWSRAALRRLGAYEARRAPMGKRGRRVPAARPDQTLPTGTRPPDRGAPGRRGRPAAPSGASSRVRSSGAGAVRGPRDTAPDHRGGADRTGPEDVPGAGVRDSVGLDGADDPIGDRVLVDKLTPWFGSKPQRGDVVVFEDPGGWLEDEQKRRDMTPSSSSRSRTA